MNLLSLLVFLLILFFPLAERSEGKTFRDDWKPGDPVIYIRDQAPEFKMAPLKGERQEMLVPDTLTVLGRKAVVYDYFANSYGQYSHKTGYNVLYGDGSARWFRDRTEAIIRRNIDMPPGCPMR